MFASYQGLWGHKFVTRCFQTIYRQWNIDGMKHLNKKSDMTGSIKLFN